MNIILTIKNAHTKKSYDLSFPIDKNFYELEKEIIELLNFYDREFFQNKSLTKIVSGLNKCDLDMNESIKNQGIQEGDILYIY
ncbi:MAG: hypothetical protein ABF289_01540 [Clostridiales bacterium]